MDYAFYIEVFQKLLVGLPATLELAFVSVSLGMVLAVILALMRQSGIAAISWFARSYIFCFRGTPMLVQLFLIYYGMGQFRVELQAWGLWWFFREVYFCAILGLTLNTAAYGAEIIRGGLQAVPYGQIEAARACGMSGFLLFRRIVFPIAIRQALPGYANEIILMVKDTSLASIITLVEITQIAVRIGAQTYRPVAVLTCAGILYLLINIVITRIISLIEYWLTPHLRESRATT